MNDFFNFESYIPADFNFPTFEDFNNASEPIEPVEYVEPSHEEYHSEITQDGKKSHLCTFPGCGKIFKFKSEINRHLVIHFVERPFVCPSEGCNKAFKRADALENHIRIHTNDLPFQCDHPGCGLKFVTKSALRYHLLKHENQRSFVCEFEGCGKSFITKAQLRQHERAENYHKKVAAIHHVAVLEQPEPVKKLKIQDVAPIVSKDPYANLMAAPAPKLAKTLMWETKVAEDVEPMEIQPSAGQGEAVEDMLNKVLEENKMLKEKLDVYTRMMEIFQENQKLKGQLSGKADDFQFGYDSQAQESTNYPMEGSEFSFLTF